MILTSCRWPREMMLGRSIENRRPKTSSSSYTSRSTDTYFGYKTNFATSDLGNWCHCARSSSTVKCRANKSMWSQLARLQPDMVVLIYRIEKTRKRVKFTQKFYLWRWTSFTWPNAFHNLPEIPIHHRANKFNDWALFLLLLFGLKK